MKSAIKSHLQEELRKIEEQVVNLSTLLEKEENCLTLIQHSQTIQNSLSKVDAHILEQHLKSCVRKEYVTDENVEQKVKEVIKSFKNQT